MKKYLLVDGSKDEWGLGVVTARREKALAELGITRESFGDEEKGADQIATEILKECSDRLLKLIGALFTGREVKKDELEDVDKTAVQEGLLDFFMKDLELIVKYSDSAMSLISPTSEVKKPVN